MLLGATTFADTIWVLWMSNFQLRDVKIPVAACGALNVEFFVAECQLSICSMPWRRGACGSLHKQGRPSCWFLATSLYFLMVLWSCRGLV